MSIATIAPTRPATATRLPLDWQSVAVRVLFAIAVLILWELVVRLAKVPPYILPPPTGLGFVKGTLTFSENSVLAAFRHMLIDGSLRAGLLASTSRMVIGYGISVVFGLLLGVLTARIWIAKQTIGSLILALQSLPSICWLPFAIIWVGLNEGAILFVIILGATFAIAISTDGAIRNVPPIYLKVGRVLGARNFTFSRDILFFAALPELLGGLKVGWTFAWRSLMAAELLRADVPGIGSLLQTGRDFNDMPMMFATVLTILTIGVLVDSLGFGWAERKVRRRYGLEK